MVKGHVGLAQSEGRQVGSRQCQVAFFLISVSSSIHVQYIAQTPCTGEKDPKVCDKNS